MTGSSLANMSLRLASSAWAWRSGQSFQPGPTNGKRRSGCCWRSSVWRWRWAGITRFTCCWRICPAFNLFRVPARFLALFSLAMALLAGMGIESLTPIAPKAIQRGRRILLVAGFIALLIVVTRFVLQPDPSLIFGGPAISADSLAIWLGSWLLLIALLSLRRRWTQIAAAALLTAELFLAAQNLPYNDLSPPDVYLGQRFTISQLLAHASRRRHSGPDTFHQSTLL